MINDVDLLLNLRKINLRPNTFQLSALGNTSHSISFWHNMKGHIQDAYCKTRTTGCAATESRGHQKCRFSAWWGKQKLPTVLTKTPRFAY